MRSHVARIVAVVLLIAFCAGTPLFVSLLAGGVATLAGCGLHEGNAQPCSIVGVEVGEVLYAAGLTGWLLLVTVPAGAMATVVYLIFEFTRWLDRRSNRHAV
jgi:hypothetical protein